jgi:hypothetical protein
MTFENTDSQNFQRILLSKFSAICPLLERNHAKSPAKFIFKSHCLAKNNFDQLCLQAELPS